MTLIQFMSHLSASSDSELLEHPDVINEEVHEAKFVTEAHQDVQTAGVQGNAVCFLGKLFVQL